MTNTIANINVGPSITPNGAGKDAKLKKACADFESIFIYYILKSMRKSLPQNGLFGNTQEQKIYKSMADQAMSENIASARGMGLGELLYDQLK
jgi:flagellar protein FlgJ